MEPVPQKSHRPTESPFWQQKVPGWNPVYNAGTAVLPFLLAGFIFVPTGLAVFLTTHKLQEYQFDYTDCKQHNSDKTCASIIAEDPLRNCICMETLQLPEDFYQTVNVYYGLTSFYQNFRFYVQSRDDKQLLGNVQFGRSQCEPYNVNRTSGLPIFPCGAIANSLFNDTFQLRYMLGPTTIRDVPVDTGNISWPSDRALKFKSLKMDNLTGVAKPPNWHEPVTQIPNGLQNEALIVWMRTAALPWLRKLYGRVESTGEFANVLPRGEYELEIHYRYPVAIFGGTKRLILSNAGWMGSRNPFIAIAFFCVGLLCAALGLSFMFIDKKFGSLEYPMPEVSDFYEKRKPLKGRRASTFPVPKGRSDNVADQQASQTSLSE